MTGIRFLLFGDLLCDAVNVAASEQNRTGRNRYDRARREAAAQDLAGICIICRLNAAELRHE